LYEETWGKNSVRKSRRKWKVNVKVDFQETEWKTLHSIALTWDKENFRDFVNRVLTRVTIKWEESLPAEEILAS
jgi:hypothetical protein